MLCTVYLFDTRNGNKAAYEWESRGMELETMHYLWTGGGNYTCDCNRSPFMYGWDGANTINECSDGIIHVLKIAKPDGTEIPPPDGGWNNYDY